MQSLLAEAVRAPLKPERKPATTKLCTGTEQGQLEWPFLSFLCAHNRQKEKKDNSVLMTLTLGPSGAMPQLIYLMLQPDFFFFFFKNVVVFKQPDLLQLSGCWRVHKPVTSRHPGYMEIEERVCALMSALAVSHLTCLSRPRLRAALKPLQLLQDLCI